MTFSRTTEYALRILTFMAVEERDKYSSDYIYRRLKIPKKYLQRLLTLLSKSGLIKSERGKYGGYGFAKKINKIFLSDIIRAVEGFPTEPGCFFGFGKCLLDNPCAMHDIWVESQTNLINVLSSVALSDLKKKMK